MVSNRNFAMKRRREPYLRTSRNFATAAEPTALERPAYMSLDDASLSSMDPPKMFDPSRDHNLLLPSMGTSSLLILNETPQTQPKVLRRVRGIGGDEEEMMVNFDMALRVARFDRAAALITRLGSLYPVSSPEYLSLHNRYLDAMVSHMIITRQPGMVRPLQKWFEVDMPAGGVNPDATTFAIMIRMALRMLHGTKRDRAVRRYWHLAKMNALHEEMLAVEVLSDLELGELSKVRIKIHSIHLTIYLIHLLMRLTLDLFFRPTAGYF